MDSITRDHVQALADVDGGRCVSLFLATHRGAGAEDAVRWRNLVHEAGERLVAAEARRPEACELLAPARRVRDDRKFWRHPGDGLACFLRGLERWYHLPHTIANRAAAGSCFHVKPLLPLIQVSEAPEQMAARCVQQAETGRTCSDLARIVPAAADGRVECLFVPLDRDQWGQWDANSQVMLHDEVGPGDEDLFNLAAVHTVRHGGTVFGVSGPSVPAVALFRVPHTRTVL